MSRTLIIKLVIALFLTFTALSVLGHFAHHTNPSPPHTHTPATNPPTTQTSSNSQTHDAEIRRDAERHALATKYTEDTRTLNEQIKKENDAYNLGKQTAQQQAAQQQATTTDKASKSNTSTPNNNNVSNGTTRTTSSTNKATGKVTTWTCTYDSTRTHKTCVKS